MKVLTKRLRTLALAHQVQRLRWFYLTSSIFFVAVNSLPIFTV